MTKSHSDKPDYPETLSKSDDYSPWTISSGELARYFGVRRVRVSGLFYYGLVDAGHARPAALCALPLAVPAVAAAEKLTRILPASYL